MHCAAKVVCALTNQIRSRKKSAMSVSQHRRNRKIRPRRNLGNVAAPPRDCEDEHERQQELLLMIEYASDDWTDEQIEAVLHPPRGIKP